MWKTVFFRGLAGATGIVSSWKRGLGCSDIIPSHQEPVESLSHPPTHPPAPRGVSCLWGFGITGCPSPVVSGSEVKLSHIIP